MGHGLELKKIVKEIENTLGFTHKALADALNTNENRVKQLAAGNIKSFKEEEIDILVNKYKLSRVWILTGEGEILESRAQDNNLHIDNKKIFDYVQKKLPSIFEKVANADPRTLSQDDRDIEDFLGRITEIHLVQCVSDTNSWAENVVFAFMFLDNQQLIYVPSGYMNFMNGGHSGLIPFGRWLQKRSLMGKLSLKHVEYDLFRAHLEKSEYTADVIEIPEYTDRELAKEYFKSFVKGERWGDKAGELF